MKFVDLYFEVHLEMINGLYPLPEIVKLMLKTPLSFPSKNLPEPLR